MGCQNNKCHSHHHGSRGNYCNCGCSDCTCHPGKTKSHCHTGNEKHDMFVSMADKAWEAVFMEKAKAHWEKLHGKDMDKMAEAAVKTSMAYHMGMMKHNKEVAEAAKDIDKAMSG